MQCGVQGGSGGIEAFEGGSQLLGGGGGARVRLALCAGRDERGGGLEALDERSEGEKRGVVAKGSATHTQALQHGRGGVVQVQRGGAEYDGALCVARAGGEAGEGGAHRPAHEAEQ